jgi:Mrp family chromosome partitioning ATPase
MKGLLKQASALYDHVIIDSPPMGSVTDPVVLSTMVDGVILVVQGGKNSRQAVQRGCQEFTAVGAKIFGVVLNNVDLKREGYDDYYYYSSYYGHGDDGDKRRA